MENPTLGVNALAQKMVAAVRSYVDQAVSAVNARMDEFDARLQAIPKGEKGEKGEPGEAGKGDQGVPGERGKDAEPIHPDTLALMVREAVEKAVSALPVAKDGAPGRDATELVPLLGIDETRSYPAGTYAQHNGGEIRAARRTDPVQDGDLLAAGWTVAREGTAAIVVTQGDDPRQIEVATMLTSGTKAVTEFYIPAVLDKGVWREGEYVKGDHASWDGSGWIAQRKTTDKPGVSDAWRLSTKRGRDGKDGIGTKGDPGPPGKNGADLTHMAPDGTKYR